MSEHTLVESNLGLAVSVARSMYHTSHRLRNIGDWDDVVQVAFLGLVKAARGFKPELGYEFSTYATHAVRRTLISESKRVYARERFAPLSEDYDPPQREPEKLHHEELPDVRKVLSWLSDSQRALLEARYGIGCEPKTFDELANGKSKQAVRGRFQTAMRRAREFAGVH